MSIKERLLALGRRLQTEIKVFGCRKVLTYGAGLHVGARTRIWAPNHVRIGNQVYVGKDVHIEANCRIGNYCLIANRVAVVGRHDHDFYAVGFPMRYSPWIGSKRFPSKYIDEEAVIGDDVWLGYGAIVLTGVNIGKGSVIAAGSVVVDDIPAYSIAAGVPARVVGKRFDDQTVSHHESAMENGHFSFSERGYDSCVIEPALAERVTSR
jgi:acetyltransferase-like isoleucine patch superfamily enzyme